MDLILSPIPANAVHLTMNGLGTEDRSLTSIGSGAQVTMRHGKASENVSLQFRDDGECFVNYMEMNAALAKRLKLQPSRRYRLEYDANAERLTIQPSPVSSASAALKSGGQLSPRSIYIGFALRSILGIPEQRGLSILLRSGSIQRRLSVYTPSNLFDSGLKLSPSTARALSLPLGAPLLLAYDQRTRTLTARALNASRDNQTGGT